MNFVINFNKNNQNEVHKTYVPILLYYFFHLYFRKIQFRTVKFMIIDLKL